MAASCVKYEGNLSVAWKRGAGPDAILKLKVLWFCVSVLNEVKEWFNSLAVKIT